MSKLTAKQQRFVDEYLVDLNATQAAVRAGYSEKASRQIGAENLAKPYIADIIKERLAAREVDTKQREEKAILNQQWVIDRLIENVDRSMQAEPVLDREGEPTGEYTYQGNVANGALKLLGLQLGMFAERHKHEFPDLPAPERVNRLAEILNSAKERVKSTNGHANGNGTH